MTRCHSRSTAPQFPPCIGRPCPPAGGCFPSSSATPLREAASPSVECPHRRLALESSPRVVNLLHSCIAEFVGDLLLRVIVDTFPFLFPSPSIFHVDRKASGTHNGAWLQNWYARRSAERISGPVAWVPVLEPEDGYWKIAADGLEIGPQGKSSSPRFLFLLLSASLLRFLHPFHPNPHHKRKAVQIQPNFCAQKIGGITSVFCGLARFTSLRPVAIL